MAQWFKPTKEQEDEYSKWIESRPVKVQEIAKKFLPWNLYKLPNDGHRVYIHAIEENEDGSITVQVAVTSKFNFVIFDRVVFGVNPNELIPCNDVEDFSVAC